MAVKTIAKYECAGYNNSICDKVKATPHNSQQAHLRADYFGIFHKFRRQRTLLLPPLFVLSTEKSAYASTPPELCGIA